MQRNELSDPNTNTLGDIRKPAIHAVQSLLSMISLLNQVTANPALSTLIEQLDNHIARSMSRARLSYSLNGKEEISEENLTNTLSEK